MAQLSTKVQAFTGETKGAIVGEIATILITLQEEIGVINPKERPCQGILLVDRPTNRGPSSPCT
jgi:hypothetical protein